MSSRRRSSRSCRRGADRGVRDRGAPGRARRGRSPLEQSPSSLRVSPGTSTTNSLKKGASYDGRVPARSSCSAGVAGEGRDFSASSPQPSPSEQRRVDGGAQRHQSLVRADVARRPLAPDVLLARGQGHDEGALFGRIDGLADQAAGELAHVPLARGHEADVGPAEARAGRRSSVPRRTRCRPRRSRGLPQQASARAP